MKIEILKVGNLETNCYIITHNNKSIIIDPGDDFPVIRDFCNEKNIIGILVTHHHFDHTGALESCEKFYNLKHNQEEMNGFHFKTIKNPGHSEDSISFYFPEENVLFGGDFIFQNGIGRCDLESGDFKKMQTSIHMILKYPKNTTIYPGHGMNTTLEKEEFNLKKYL